MKAQKTINIHLSLKYLAIVFVIWLIILFLLIASVFMLKAGINDYIAYKSGEHIYRASKRLGSPIFLIAIFLPLTLYLFILLINSFIAFLNKTGVVITQSKVILKKQTKNISIPFKDIDLIGFQKIFINKMGISDALVIKIKDGSEHYHNLQATKISWWPPKPLVYRIQKNKTEGLRIEIPFRQDQNYLNLNIDDVKSALNTLGIKYMNLPDNFKNKTQKLNLMCVYCKQEFYVNVSLDRSTSFIIGNTEGLDRSPSLIARCPYCSKLNMDAWCKKCGVGSMVVPIEIEKSKIGRSAKLFNNGPLATVDKRLEDKPTYWTCTQCKTEWPITKEDYENILEGKVYK